MQSSRQIVRTSVKTKFRRQEEARITQKKKPKPHNQSRQQEREETDGYSNY